MIFKETLLKVVDNSGARVANCFSIYAAGKYAKVGDIIMVSIRDAIPKGKVTKGQKYKAVIVNTVAPIKRKGGDSVSFSKNAVVLLQASGELLGTRITSTVPREVSQKIRSLAVGVC